LYVADEHFISLATWQGDQVKPKGCLALAAETSVATLG
jgi:hypothetical protein